ncbi:polysaccharide biosynthesis protein [Lentibacter algarum]|uniref:polysaccharide biosynthesis protein n=1 Tax=Lentibacter algarum TaxID=576131 RepID=UPI003AF998AD
MRRVISISSHWVLWTAGYVGAYALRFEGLPPESMRGPALVGLLLLLFGLTAAFWISGLFHGIFRYVGVPEILDILRSVAIVTACMVGVGVFVPEASLPRSIYVGQFVLCILASAGLRLAVRVWRERPAESAGKGRPAILIGAGDAGEMLLRDLERHPAAYINVVAILDDDRAKHGQKIRGIRVYGRADAEALGALAEGDQVSIAILAMPSATGQRIREIVNECHRLGLETKTLPSLRQIVAGSVNVSMLRDVVIEDLLCRDPIHLDENAMSRLLYKKRVLITGGAGSIGSELAAQALRYAPNAVFLLDHNENGLFFLERALEDKAGVCQVTPIIADIRDAVRMEDVMRTHRPEVVLHAAAHKHVPLMEQNPTEAVKNNALGTRAMADLAALHGVETFVLISTDKAVRPTSVMGATKRMAEIYVQSLSKKTPECRFVTVRFGNVLGSAGSVVQIFREQIAAGGPVCVTHEDMTRFFMTIPEACQLVLQAGALGESGKVNILDMGEPVKILDLARDMIRMSGFDPDKDIVVNVTGIRPGEKLYEELVLEAVGAEERVHPKILVDDIPVWDFENSQTALASLEGSLDEGADGIRAELGRLLPEAALGQQPPSSPESMWVKKAAPAPAAPTKPLSTPAARTA